MLTLRLEGDGNEIVICGDAFIKRPESIEVHKNGELVVAYPAGHPDAKWERAYIMNDVGATVSTYKFKAARGR